MKIRHLHFFSSPAGSHLPAIVRILTRPPADQPRPSRQQTYRGVSAHRGIAEAVPLSRLVPRRKARDLGGLGTGVGADAGRLVRAEPVPPRTIPRHKFHVEHYGHPSKFGFKDIIPLWKAEKWDPDRLMALYQKAGANTSA